MEKIDVSDKIQRIEVFEEKFGVDVKKVSALADEDNNISIMFELHPIESNKLKQDTKVIVAVYNLNNQVILKQERVYAAESFWGFEIGECLLRGFAPEGISKIRIYPTQA